MKKYLTLVFLFGLFCSWYVSYNGYATTFYYNVFKNFNSTSNNQLFYYFKKESYQVIINEDKSSNINKPVSLFSESPTVSINESSNIIESNNIIIESANKESEQLI